MTEGELMAAKVMWNGDVVDTAGGTEEYEYPALTLSDGSTLELWGEGITLPGGDRMLTWEELVKRLKEPSGISA